MEEYRIIKVKLNQESLVSHHLFFKKHKLGKSENDSKNFASKTLFVSNIPPYYNEQGLKNVFSVFGKVDHVFIYSKPTLNPFDKLNENKEKKSYFDEDENIEENGFKVAYIVFNNEQSLEKSLKNSEDKERFLLNDTDSLQTGMKKWIDNYKKNFVDAKQLNKEIDEFMINYDDEKLRKEKEDIEKLNQPDEDGWITVTPKSRKSNLAFTERNIEKMKTKQKKKRQQMQLINFYSFQMKESKKEYITQLRKKFEEDKKRIETMKQTRKFKPF